MSVLQLLMSYEDTDPHQAFLAGYFLVTSLHQNVLHNVFIVGVAQARIMIRGLRLIMFQQNRFSSIFFAQKEGELLRHMFPEQFSALYWNPLFVCQRVSVCVCVGERGLPAFKSTRGVSVNDTYSVPINA